MIYIAGIILFFTGIKLLVASTNLAFRQPFPKTGQPSNALVSILIPARNEENNIRNILSDLKNQNYLNMEILVFNDQSSDKTSQIVSEMARNDARIRLLESGGLPAGWLGKNFACYSLSQRAAGKHFLFLDADVRINGDIIQQTISFSEKNRLGLLSIFPRQRMKTWGEYVTVPNMNFILLSLLPLVLVRKLKFPSLSAANGQFMLFNAGIYKKLNPHKKMKTEKVEDIKIARLFKKEKIPVACLTGTKNISCRMYNNYSGAVNGFSKNVIAYFGDSTFLAILFWLITTFGFLFVLFVFPKGVFAAYIAAVVFIRIFVSLASKQNAFRNIVLLIPQQITLGIFIAKAIVKRMNKNLEWKGRNIS
jgi:cellulose synthase/poly-beta-1,6-N-acetylglucosamine synthase-like glycosyltransferase